MGRYVADYLAPSMAIGEHSIGADFVKNSVAPDYLAYGVEVLRIGLTKMLKSESPEDKEAAARINQDFKRNDSQLAIRDLTPEIEKPLQSNVVEWLASATDHDVQLFCRWSLERTMDLTKSLNRDKRLLAGNAMEKVEKLVSIGMFPNSAIAVTQTALDRYQLQGIDAFHSGGVPRVGFCDNQTIGFANRYTNRESLIKPSYDMKYIMFHESIHAAGKDRGFFRGISEYRSVLRIIEEAFVEHATVVAHTRFFKLPHIIDPKKRLLSMSPGIYRLERTFLDVTCDYTNTSVQQLSEAYFRPRGDERGERLREDIERKIGAFFGHKEHFFAFADEYEEATHSQHEKLITTTIEKLKQADRPVPDLL